MHPQFPTTLPPDIYHRISTPLATIAKDRSPGTTLGRALQPAVCYPHIHPMSRRILRRILHAMHGPPPHISSGLNLVDFWCAPGGCQIKFRKNRFLTKSGIFGCEAMTKIGIWMTWSFSGFSPLQPGFGHREHRNPYFSNLAIRGGRGVRGGWGGTLTHFGYPAVASH